MDDRTTVAEMLRTMSANHPSGARFASTYERWIADKAPRWENGPPLAMSPDNLSAWRSHEVRRFLNALEILAEAGARMANCG